MTVSPRRAARIAASAFIVVLLAQASGVTLLAQCASALVAGGQGSFVAPGLRKQAYTPFPIDLTAYASGVLVIEIALDLGESGGSFDLFPAGVTLPTDGEPVSNVIPGSYDVRPGSAVVLSYPFSRPGRYLLGATGNWGSRVGATNTFTFSARVENGTPAAPGTIAPPPPVVPPPSSASARFCCSLGQAALSGGGAIDPARLHGHRYGTEGMVTPLGEPIGFVYTTNAGLIDLGHVRDLVDRTRAIYSLLSQSPAAFSLSGSRILVPAVPADAQARLDLASAIAFVDGLAHELETWDTSVQDFSAFSPEDLVSNMVGIELGRRVINADGDRTDDDFNRCVDALMPAMMRELNAVPEARTSAMLKSIEGSGNWYVTYTRYESLERRNFTGTPWFARTPRDPLPMVPRWLTTERVTASYRRFVYVMKAPVKGAKIPAGGVAPAAVSLWIQTPTARFLPCGGTDEFPGSPIQLKDSAGTSVPGQVTCVEDANGALTLTTLQAATEAVRRAWLGSHDGMAQCGFWRESTSVTAEIFQAVGLLDGAPACR